MPKTVIEKSQSPSPDVTVFSVSGTLGFHEKDTLAKLFEECKKRNLTRVVMDVSELTSLGGGCANIIRAVAASGELALGISGAKATVLKFLKDDGQIVISDTVEEVASKLTGVDVAASGAGAKGADASPIDDGQEPNQPADSKAKAFEQPPVTATSADGENTIIILGLDPVEDDQYAAGETDSPSPGESAAGDAVREAETPTSKAAATTPPPKPKKAGDTSKSKTPQAPDDASTRDHLATPKKPTGGAANTGGDGGESVDPRELQKRIVQYNTVFSLNSDFYRIHDRTSLLELFLLTTIAQVGVESAMFLQLRQGYFTPAAVKGLEADELKGFALPANGIDLVTWKETLAIYTIENAPFSDEVKAPLLSLGCSYFAPFIVYNEFRGFLALGKPIKSDLDEGTTSFLKILINQAALAFESTQRLEEEKERTLGLVQTLIALIEENTLARGNTNLLSSYTYALARKLHYPEEHLRDLMYGSVLRDIGMIKVSDLIVRSPRELMPEEWEIIKRHPTEGTEMLRKMKFSDHAITIVLSHHERFNGEGYPDGLQGKQIPLGARIVSVVESYAAMLQERPTRPALTQEEALNTLKENWGMRYDPDLVKAFAELVEAELRTGNRIQDQKFELFSL
jgi:hypothetical protein